MKAEILDRIKQLGGDISDLKIFLDWAGRARPDRECYLVGDRSKLARAYPEYAPGQRRPVLAAISA